MIREIFQTVLASASKLISGVRVEWHDALPVDTRPRIYFANHGSHLDFAVIWSALPKAVRRCTRPVAAKDYWGGSPVRRYLATAVFDAILVERKKLTKESNPIDGFVAALEGGTSIILFPEGTRGSDGEVAEFKAGLWHLAKRVPEIPLVPVYLQNLNRILPKGEYLPIPLLSWCHFGAPAHLAEGEAKAPFLNRMRDLLLTLSQPHDQ